jgi:hypothetical protein
MFRLSNIHSRTTQRLHKGMDDKYSFARWLNTAWYRISGKAPFLL